MLSVLWLAPSAFGVYALLGVSVASIVIAAFTLRAVKDPQIVKPWKLCDGIGGGTRYMGSAC